LSSQAGPEAAEALSETRFKSIPFTLLLIHYDKALFARTIRSLSLRPRSCQWPF